MSYISLDKATRKGDVLKITYRSPWFSQKVHDDKAGNRERVAQYTRKPTCTSAYNPRLESLTKLTCGAVGSFLWGDKLRHLNQIVLPNNWTLRRCSSSEHIHVSIGVIRGENPVYNYAYTVRVVKVSAFSKTPSPYYLCDNCNRRSRSLYICRHIKDHPLLCWSCSGCMRTSDYYGLSQKSARGTARGIERFYRQQDKLYGHVKGYETVAFNDYAFLEYQIKARKKYKKRVNPRLEKIANDIHAVATYDL